MTKEKIVVVCPGRGSYIKETLGYLQKKSQKYNSKKFQDFLIDLDSRRKKDGEVTISELDDSKKFTTSLHTLGENASTLIYACAFADFLSIDQEKYEIVAITGNSMGWYLALAFSGALDWAGGYQVIHTMGSMMRDELIGGQIIYPVMDDSWRLDAQQLQMVEQTLAKVASLPSCEVYLSIRLGGYVVIAGNDEGLSAIQKLLPAKEHYPFRLVNHGAFHTPMLKEITQRALRKIPLGLFSKPTVPMIDGRGKVWTPYATDIEDLYDYTFGHQVSKTYDFTAAESVALKEFAPDRVVLLGPGNSLGGAIGQVMVRNDWHNINDKESFKKRQQQDPLLLSMGLSS